MMQVISTLHTILFRPRKAEFTASTDPTREPDADQPAEFQPVGVRDVGTECDDLADPFVAADVGEFDLCYGVAVWTGCCAGFGVEVFFC